MSLLKAKWLPGGQVEVPPIPMAGDREVKDLMLQDHDVDAIFRTFKFISLAKALLESKKVIQQLGVEKAWESWNDYVTTEFPGAHSTFVWPFDEFVQNLDATYARVIGQQLACGSPEEAALKLSNMSKQTKDMAKSIDPAVSKRLASRPLVVLYWRLRAAEVKQVITLAGTIDLPWAHDPKDDKQKVMDILASVVSEDELKTLDEPVSKRPFDMSEVKPHTAADVAGKSETASQPLMSSRPDLPRSSAVTAGPGSDQATPGP